MVRRIKRNFSNGGVVFMELYLQLGYGMKQLSIDLAKKWGKATVILSPRDIPPEK